MRQNTSESPDIVVIGRVDFGTGIGQHTAGLCEVLSRAYNVQLYPTRIDHTPTFVDLPSGRRIPTCFEPSRAKMTIFADVLWNGLSDHLFNLVPETGLRVAYFVFDSDALPDRWVEILNGRFDWGWVPSSHLIPIAKASGVTVPVQHLPLPIDIEAILPLAALPSRRDKTVFGTLSAFHPRKGMDLLIKSFHAAFGDDETAELRLRGNLDFQNTRAKLEAIVDRLNCTNIKIEHHNTSHEEKCNYLNSLDVYVSASHGEGFSIGPREALALGKPLLISNVGAHFDLEETPGVMLAPAPIEVPALYPEIDGRIFGKQHKVTVAKFSELMLEMREKSVSGELDATAIRRKQKAAQYSYTRLTSKYISSINPEEYMFRKSGAYSLTTPTQPLFRKAAAVVGRFSGGLGSNNRRVVLAHDGGYFSVFNVYFSFLVCDSFDPKVRLVLPDWDVTRVMKKREVDKFTSFCYASPTDGNVWVKLYEPLFSLSVDDYNDEDFLYQNYLPSNPTYNEKREPLLTYKHAYRLYRTPEFARWRKLYHRVYRDHIRLAPSFAAEFEGIKTKMFSGRYMIGAHVRHPSHSMEQPGAVMGTADRYVNLVRQEVKSRGFNEASDEWGVFLATDQDTVVERFQQEYGEKVCFFGDVKRTTVEHDAAFASLSAQEKAKEGFQIQHLTAQDATKWHHRMAWEVIRDAMCLAECRVLFHVTSNISTAVAYFNPDVRLEYVEPTG